MQVIYEFTAHHAALSEPPHQSAFNLLLLRFKVQNKNHRSTTLEEYRKLLSLFNILFSHFCYQLVISAISSKGHYPVVFPQLSLFQGSKLLHHYVALLDHLFQLFNRIVQSVQICFHLKFSPFYVLWAISSYHSLALPQPFVALERLSLFFSHSFNLAGQKQNLLFLYCTINLLQLSPQQVRVLT